MKHLFIVNPAAGKRNSAADFLRRVEEAFRSLPEERYETVLTQAAGDATAVTVRAAESGEDVRIYACGGDGTLNEVVQGAAEQKNLAVCPIPLGSGNDFIKYFEDISREKFLDLPACIRGEARPCDLLQVNDAWCLNIASVGLDAVTAARQQKVKRIPLVPAGFAYKLALGYSFLNNMKNPIRFQVDGEDVEVGGGMVAIAVAGNGKFYGGGFKATPTANIRDGLIDFIAVPSISHLEFLKYVGDYQKGLHMESMRDFLFYRRCREIRLFSPQPLVVQADGEIYRLKDPKIRIVPAALRLILPEGSEHS